MTDPLDLNVAELAADLAILEACPDLDPITRRLVTNLRAAINRWKEEGNGPDERDAG
jgi:hypothetical protein